jgi:hypothetical protein
MFIPSISKFVEPNTPVTLRTYSIVRDYCVWVRLSTCENRSTGSKTSPIVSL